MNIIIALLGFGFLVLVHELGHYFLARANGVKVEEFSIGMGPTIVSKKGKETVWSIKALPIGGACQMKGEATGETDGSHDSFQEKTPLQRMSIIAAGPIMNLITAIVLFTIIVGTNGFSDSTVTEIVPDTPAMAAGLQAGDRIVSVDGYKTDTFSDVQTVLLSGGEVQRTFIVDRNGEKMETKLTPKKDEKTGAFFVGIRGEEKPAGGFLETIAKGYRVMRSNVRTTLLSVKMLLTGKLGMDNVGGPVVVIGMASSASQAGAAIFLKFLAMISVTLAVFNLLPFPALDGGWLLLLLVELITRRKIPEKYVAIWNGIGFVCLMTLMVLVTFKDVFNLIRR